MKELVLESMEQISGGVKLPDAGCVVKHGLAGAVSGVSLVPLQVLFGLLV